MKISAQEEYGLRCLMRLAQAEEGHSLTLPEVAAAEGLSVPYVAKLLAVLRQAGLIDSARGRTGGYRLAKAPAEVLFDDEKAMILTAAQHVLEYARQKIWLPRCKAVGEALGPWRTRTTQDATSNEPRIGAARAGAGAEQRSRTGSNLGCHQQTGL